MINTLNIFNEYHAVQDVVPNIHPKLKATLVLSPKQKLELNNDHLLPQFHVQLRAD
uniref:Uncharacterized protein n=1 Tax=Meloidogyne incognita TaxID=6306 RepID=A0A914MGD2_MELIC